MTARTLVNGAPQQTVSSLDRGLHYGDGVFETLRVEQGRLRWFERHLARLERGCERLGIAPPPRAVLQAEAGSLAAALPRALVKIIVTRGTATARGYRPAGDEQPTRIVSVHDWPVASGAAYRLGLSAVTLGRNRLLGGIKHLNRLEQVLAQRAAARSGVDETVMCRSDGAVVCGSMTNLFLWEGSTLLTPPIEDCGVEGVMRSLVLECAPRLGLAVRVGPLTPAQLEAAPALFVTNVRLGVQAVNWYQGHALGTDPRCRPLQELIDATPA